MGREVLLGIAILHPAVRRSGTEKHMKRNHMTLAATTVATVPGGVVPGGLSGFTNLSPVHTGGAGDFTASVECTTFSNCNGGSAPTVTGLTFTVTNATVAQLETKNASGNFFAADILL